MAAWREAPYFTDAERAALASPRLPRVLPIERTRFPTRFWNEATKHYDEKGLAAIILMIATTNLFNRLNATTRQVAGAGW